MTQQNAALVEQSAAAAQSMRDQAQRLSGAVQVFKLGRCADARLSIACTHPAAWLVGARPARGRGLPGMTGMACRPI
jgi:hypothetical protein